MFCRCIFIISEFINIVMDLSILGGQKEWRIRSLLLYFILILIPHYFFSSEHPAAIIFFSLWRIFWVFRYFKVSECPIVLFLFFRETNQNLMLLTSLRQACQHIFWVQTLSPSLLKKKAHPYRSSHPACPNEPISQPVLWGNKRTLVSRKRNYKDDFGISYWMTMREKLLQI